MYCDNCYTLLWQGSSKNMCHGNFVNNCLLLVFVTICLLFHVCDNIFLCFIFRKMINTGLSIVGYYWVILSMISTICICIGFYMPYWIVGNLELNGIKTEVYMGSFRRCNFPVFVAVSLKVRKNSTIFLWRRRNNSESKIFVDVM